jgi:hypothetical protein
MLLSTIQLIYSDKNKMNYCIVEEINGRGSLPIHIHIIKFPQLEHSIVTNMGHSIFNWQLRSFTL